MATERQLREWRRYRRESERRLRPGILIAGVATLGLLAAVHLARAPLPPWGEALLLLAFWFQVVGDFLNVRLLNRRIAEAERAS